MAHANQRRFLSFTSYRSLFSVSGLEAKGKVPGLPGKSKKRFPTKQAEDSKSGAVWQRPAVLKLVVLTGHWVTFLNQ